MTPESIFKTLTFMSATDLDHVLMDHVQLDQTESYHVYKRIAVSENVQSRINSSTALFLQYSQK